MRENPDGVLLVDKPAGLTSHAVVDRVRHVTGTRRIGHSGTLDPFATGLLTLLIGRATRLAPFVEPDPKVYCATIRFGLATTTDDATGEPLREAPAPDAAGIDRAIAGLTGHLLQRPPAYSAKQVGGVRAYAAARRGKPLTLEPAHVEVYEWRVGARNGCDLSVEVSCSGGTYVRALARDLGESAGSAAHLVSLRRVRSGRFSIDDAQPMDQVEGGALRILPPSAAVAQLPTQTVDDLEAKRLVHGQPVPARIAGERAALLQGGELLAVAIREGDTWRPKVVMRDA